MANLSAVHTGGSWTNDALTDTVQAFSGEGQIKRILFKSASVTIGTLADGAGTTQSVSVPGAALGDVVLVGINADAVDVLITAYVQAANTVEIRAQNESTAGRAIGAVTANILVFDVT